MPSAYSRISLPTGASAFSNPTSSLHQIQILQYLTISSLAYVLKITPIILLSFDVLFSKISPECLQLSSFCEKSL